jgi:hypothetical protein
MGLRGNAHQMIDIGKYLFVNMIIQLWKQLPADALGTLSSKPSTVKLGYNVIKGTQK